MSGLPDSVNEGRADQRASAAGFTRRANFSSDWITRPLFGIVLAALAVGVTIRGGSAFAGFLLMMCAAGAREWHRMFARHNLWPPTLVTLGAMGASLLLELGVHDHMLPASAAFMPYVVLWGGSMLQLPLAYLRGEPPLAHAGGVVYLGVPALALLLLRLSAPHPLATVLMMFLAIWATDTGALIAGGLIGGPKLAVAWSPNKTWAGALGGLISAGLAASAFAFFVAGVFLPAVAFAVTISIAGQIGDLFESVMKRRAGRKNSGELIPGHGGVLDRIDSSLFAAPFAAAMVLGMGFDPISGGIS